MNRRSAFGGVGTPVRPLAALVTLLVAHLASSCDRSPSESHEAGFVIRDSAGIEIVVNHAPEQLPGHFWSIDPEPEIVIGEQRHMAVDATDSAHMVWQVSGLARLEDGRVAVLSAGNRQLFLFDATGQLVRRIGRAGRGPGEFRRPDHLQYLPPDTLAVWDTWFGPISFFDLEGNLLRERLLDLGLIIERTGANAESPRVPLPDGSFVAVVAEEDPTFQPAPGSVFRFEPADYVRVDANYTPYSLGSWTGLEMWNPGRGIDTPFFAYYVLDSHVAGGGDPLLIYVSEGDRNEIRQFAPDGSLLRIIRRTADPVPVTDRSREGWLQVVSETDARVLESMPKRNHYPTEGGLVVDSEGYLWVREWSDSESGMPDQWSVFSPEGRWLGIVPGVSPHPVRCMRMGPPCWIGPDFFLTVRRDELGVERVEGYRIRRGPGTPTAQREVGDVFQDCEACPAMVVVPAGEFMMGTAEWEGAEQEARSEWPLHEVTIGAPLAVGVYEVTFDEWDSCVQAGGCNGHNPDDEGWGRERRPVIDVNWHDAQAYVQWLSQSTGQQYRLLSEAEWEYVARAGTATSHYWGEDASLQCRYANGYDAAGYRVRPLEYARPVDCDDGYDATAPVGSFEPNAFGLYDVLGNVEEWTEDCWDFGYAEAPADGSAAIAGVCDNRIVRGGNWGAPSPVLRSAKRLRPPIDTRRSVAGFRVARGLRPRAREPARTGLRRRRFDRAGVDRYAGVSRLRDSQARIGGHAWVCLRVLSRSP